MSQVFTSEVLYERLLTFAKRCQQLIRKLPKTVYNIEYGSQLIRSSASPGANYIEAIEASSHQNFLIFNSYLREKSNNEKIVH